MLGKYRKRFVLLNMLLIGIVLTAVFVSLFLFLCRKDYTELENTLRLTLSPLNRFGEDFKQLEDSGAKPRGEKETDGRPKYPDMKVPEQRVNGVTTVFYDSETEEMSVLDDGASVDEDILTAAVEAIIDAEDQFGKLKEYGLIYFKEGIASFHKISMVSDTYYHTRTFRNFIGLFLAFVVAMGLFCLISIRLSSLAARPMEDAMQMERQFVADISHDLKTPITVILANSSILKSRLNDTVSDQIQWIDSTQTAAKNMMVMVSEMLTLSSLEFVEKTEKLERVDLSSAAEKTVLQMESVAYDRGIIMEADIQENIFVTGKDEYVERICSGLLDNALKYEPQGGKAGLALRAEKKKAVLCVTNYAKIISQEDMEHIFERFYRGDKARSSESGHGLGLPIIKKITELMKAKISVSSSPEAGTSFTVEFDLAE